MKLILTVLLVSCASVLSLSPMPEYVPSGYKEATIDAYIDNFDLASSETFKMRYMIKMDYFGQNKTNVTPIFFYCGNEASIDLFVNNTGYIDDLADKLGAIVVYAEHRYFGESLPYGSESFSKQEYRKFLSPHQALADYAHLANYLKTSYQNAPVIAWGGSYGGMLAAWMRMKYPNVIAGAIASSAPLNHFLGLVDPFEFTRIVTDNFAGILPSCPAYIREGFKKLEEFSTNSTLYNKIQLAFNTCEALETQEDVMEIATWLRTGFTYLAMMNYPYDTNFLARLPANPVNASCYVLEDNVSNIDDTWKLFEAMTTAANVWYNYTNPTPCSNTKQSTNGATNIGEEGWSYLTCTYLNMPISSDIEQDMFLNDLWDQISVNSKCLQRWGEAPDINYATEHFGATWDPSFYLRDATNIVFANGALDPWQAGAVTKDFNSKVIAFVMPGAAHHLELREENELDPPGIEAGRNIEKQSILNWLEEYIF